MNHHVVVTKIVMWSSKNIGGVLFPAYTEFLTLAQSLPLCSQMQNHSQEKTGVSGGTE